MNLTLKKLIKILLDDTKFLVIFFLSSILFYPIYYFSFQLNNPKVILKVDSKYNYTIPNSISSFLSDTFINHLKDKIENKYFLNKGLKCIVKINENTKNKALECIAPKENKDEQIKNFKTLINEIYNQHIENLYNSIKYAPPSFIDLRLRGENANNNDPNLIFLEKERDLKFYLSIEIKDKENIFNFAHYILSVIFILFLNIFRVILKY
jgi:hypothetical protein